MNGIPLIFNERQIDRTILGEENDREIDFSAILINWHGNHYRQKILENLLHCGFSSIVSIENNQKSYDMEELAQQFPNVKFVVPLEDLTIGERINLGMSETNGKYVFVVRDNFSVSKNMTNKRMLESLVENDPYCIVPRMVYEKDCVSESFTPSFDGRKLDLVQDSEIFDGKTTIFVQDFVALYNRKKFMELGGFDYTIQAEYWQNLDLCFRAWLWGEKITISTIFTISYNQTPAPNNKSANLSSLRFFLKNLAPKFSDDHGFIPNSAFFPFFLRSSCGFIETCNQFSEAKKWVFKNKFRFKKDALNLTENWGKI